MSMLTVRNIPEPVPHALRAKAKEHGRSMEAEVRSIIAEAVFPQNRKKLGTLLTEMVSDCRLSDEEHKKYFENLR